MIDRKVCVESALFLVIYIYAPIKNAQLDTLHASFFSPEFSTQPGIETMYAPVALRSVRALSLFMQPPVSTSPVAFGR